MSPVLIVLLGFLFTLSAQTASDALAAGQAAMQSGDLTLAEQQFRAYLKTHPSSAEALSNLAAVHARREQYPEAVRLYEQALKANPRLYPIHFNLAVTLIRMKDPRAIDHLREFLKARPGEPRAQQLLGLCLIETGDNRAAITELEAAYKANPADRSIVPSLAYASVRAGDENRARDLLARTEADPFQSAFLQGLMEYRRERYAEAKALLQKAVDIDPTSASALAALGRLHIAEHEDEQAILLLRKAIQLNPSDAESHYQIGVLLDRTGKTDEGIPFLNRSLQLRAGYADPHYQLGRIAYYRNDYPAALQELEKARKILPNHESIRLLLGRTYQALGREADAKTEFAAVRRIKEAVAERDRQRIESDALMLEK